ncbi:MAG TPA: histidinol-phosphate transaminase [Vicinamibacterales bacterium]|nr:histidinol-phosphate transaminase [Vicinamibacterales bacterium]
MPYTRPDERARALRLHLNENTAGCSPAVLDAVQALTREDLSFYPDYGAVTAAVERALGVPAGWVLLTNGLDEGLHLVAQQGMLRALGRHDQSAHVVFAEPAFEMYAACAEAMGLGTRRVPPGADLAFPGAALLAALGAGTEVVYLTDPGNPTGLPVPPGVIDQVAAAAPHATVLVDEAYADFSGRSAIGPRLDERRNVVVGRSFAKAYGLAALRAGALVAHPDTLAPLRRMQPPFSLNVCSVRALDAALADRPYLDWYVAQSVESRQLVYAFCDRHRFPYWPSEANFVLLRVGERATSLVAALAARGVLIRDRSRAPGCDGCVRITAGVVDATRTCLDALEDLLATRTD